MMFKRKRRRVPGLNTTSTADISFILLSFFLITTSMDSDKGLLSQLPAKEQQTDTAEREIRESDVLRISLDAADTLRCNGEVTDIAQLRETAKAFIIASAVPLTAADSMSATPNRQQRIILLESDRQTSYNAYFNMQHAIAEAYLSVRDSYAREHFGHGYRECTEAEREEAKKHYPWSVAEAETREGGAP